MNDRHTFTIQSLHAPTVLPRVALAFSRRGLAIDRLEMYVTGDGTEATLALDSACAPREAGQIVGQLRRIVEVRAVSFGAAEALLEAAG